MFTEDCGPIGSGLANFVDMFRRSTLAIPVLTVAASVAALAGAAALALGPAVSGPVSVFAVAERGDQVQINPSPATPTARYRVTLNVNWTSSTHPATLPGNAHFSAPVFAVHAAPGDMFAVGSSASRGIEDMAERGVSSELLGELFPNDQVGQVRVATGIAAPAVGSRTFEAAVDQGKHRVSLVSMLAPSPDWFIGFDLATFVDDQWIDSITVPLGNYDSGTDSGTRFTSGNDDTRPAQPISGPRDAAFAAAVAEGAFGTVTITKIG